MRKSLIALSVAAALCSTSPVLAASVVPLSDVPAMSRIGNVGIILTIKSMRRKEEDV